MKCETKHCHNEVPKDNIKRICAYMIDERTLNSLHGYNNTPDCSCCNICRDKCHQGLFENEENE